MKLPSQNVISIYKNLVKTNACFPTPTLDWILSNFFIFANRMVKNVLLWFAFLSASDAKHQIFIGYLKFVFCEFFFKKINSLSFVLKILFHFIIFPVDLFIECYPEYARLLRNIYTCSRESVICFGLWGFLYTWKVIFYSRIIKKMMFFLYFYVFILIFKFW